MLRNIARAAEVPPDDELRIHVAATTLSMEYRARSETRDNSALDLGVEQADQPCLPLLV